MKVFLTISCYPYCVIVISEVTYVRMRNARVLRVGKICQLM